MDFDNTKAGVFFSKVDNQINRSPAARISALCWVFLHATSSLVAAPTNDNFASATVIPSNLVSVTVAGSNVGATKEALEPAHAGNAGGSSVWWSWTAQQSGFLTVSTLGSVDPGGYELDTLLGIYRGPSMSTLVEVARNDDSAMGGTYTSRAEFPVTAGTNYHVAVDGYSYDGISVSTGTIRLAVSFSVTKPVIPAAEWVLPGVAGQMLSSTNFHGKIVLLNFWATWCGPCIAEIPDLIGLHNKYSNDGFSVVGISVDNAVNGSAPRDLVSAFLDYHQINYPVGMSRPGSSIESDYGGISGIPATFIIDRENGIVHSVVGSRSLPFFEALVKPLIYSNLRARAGLTSNNLRLSWPVTAATVVIEATDGLTAPNWQPVSVTPQVEGTNQVISLPNTGTNRFYRLKVQ